MSYEFIIGMMFKSYFFFSEIELIWYLTSTCIAFVIHTASYRIHKTRHFLWIYILNLRDGTFLTFKVWTLSALLCSVLFQSFSIFCFFSNLYKERFSLNDTLLNDIAVSVYIFYTSLFHLFLRLYSIGTIGSVLPSHKYLHPGM